METVINALQRIRDNIDVFHAEWYEGAIAMAETVVPLQPYLEGVVDMGKM